MAGYLAKDDDNKVIQVFNPSEIVVVTGEGAVDVNDYHTIMSDTDVTIFIGTISTKTFALVANVPLGVDSMTTLHVSAACNLLIM